MNNKLKQYNQLLKLMWVTFVAFILIGYAIYLIIQLSKLINHEHEVIKSNEQQT